MQDGKNIQQNELDVLHVIKIIIKKQKNAALQAHTGLS